MPLYETIFITRQEVSIQDVEKMTSTFAQVLTDNGGTVVKTEQWGLRDLAYPIKKSNKAYYTMLAIDTAYGALKELERKFSLSEEVLRHVSIRVKKISSSPSAPIAKSHSDTNEVPAAAVVATEKKDVGEN
jgi:small subunit ribosomal protein S6